jgi:hypothetical protein
MNMKTPNPEFIKRICEIVSTSPYFELLSMKLVDAGVGYSSLEIDLTKKHLQPFGTVHGGVFSSIIDAAAFWAVLPEVARLNLAGPLDTPKRRYSMRPERSWLMALLLLSFYPGRRSKPIRRCPRNLSTKKRIYAVFYYLIEFGL